MAAVRFSPTKEPTLIPFRVVAENKELAVAFFGGFVVQHTNPVVFSTIERPLASKVTPGMKHWHEICSLSRLRALAGLGTTFRRSLDTCIPCLTIVYVVCQAPVLASYHPGPNIRELPRRRYHAPHHYNSRGGALLLPHRACNDPEPESQSADGI